MPRMYPENFGPACTVVPRHACSRTGYRVPAERTAHAGPSRIPHTEIVPDMRTYIALALLVCIGSPLAAQRVSGRLEGQVVDSVRSGPLVGAAVSATRLDVPRETTFVATTD